jgi:predicted RecB family endonuclease
MVVSDMAIIDKYQDVMDSRDIIERIEELEAEIKSVEDEGSECDPEVHDELRALVDLAQEASASPDWTYGEALIRDSYFEEYAEQLADDMGVEVKDEWPYRHIDWVAAARELQQDYFDVNFDGVTYWIRA